MIADIAGTSIPVLLTGESGTGKDFYARIIHRLSTNAARSFKKVDCARLNAQNLMEQLLEGTQSNDENGVCRWGTIFLDQIEDLDWPCQRALLPHLPDGETHGGEPSLSARIIASTSLDLEQEVEAGRFRRELYFRINGVSLRLPRLRERREDIPVLFDGFLREFSLELKRPRPELSHEEMETLMLHNWPGNIRELKNLAKMRVVLGHAHLVQGELRPSSPAGQAPTEGRMVTSSLKMAARAASRQTERELILKTLERTRWNRKRAAQELQISYKSLLYKLKQIAFPGTGSRKEI